MGRIEQAAGSGHIGVATGSAGFQPATVGRQDAGAPSRVSSPPREWSRVDVNGIALQVEVMGDPAGKPPLLLLHGFTGSADTWARHIPALAEHAATVAVDLIGHGRSDAPSNAARYGMERCVADLLALLDRLKVTCMAVLGYSMGARVALSLAVAAPQRVSALILESGSPGLAGEDERRARRASDEALAARIERDGVAAFVDYWAGIPLFATQRRLPQEVRDGVRRERLRHTATGLANSLRGMGTGAQPPLWDRLGEVTAPTLLVVGALDEKFRAINAAMQAALPDARLAVVPAAGHTVHLEQPEEFDRLVVAFPADDK